MAAERTTSTSPDPLARFRDRLSLPLIAAPMFLVSGVDLVAAACRNGVIGAFPTVNCRSPEQLDGWLERYRRPVAANIRSQRKGVRAGLPEPDRASLQCAAARRICRCCCGTGPRSSSPRSDRRRPCWRRCMMRARWYWPTSPRSATPSARSAAGADGLVLLTAGAGGQTGWLNPFVFVRAVRALLRRADRAGGRYRRRPCLARGRGARLRSRLHGHQIHRHGREHGRPAIQGDAGCEQRRRHPADHGLHRPADQHAAALDRGRRPRPRRPAAARRHRHRKDIDIGARENRPARWRDIWSAGHSTSGVTDVLPVDELVARTIAEYRAAKAR